MLTDTYKKTKYNKLQTINKRIHKILRRVKINPNINPLIKSMVFVSRPTKQAQGRRPDTPGIAKKCLGPIGNPLKGAPQVPGDKHSPSKVN